MVTAYQVLLEARKLVHQLLAETLTPEETVRHRVMCGNAATFQGQERDIVFLSMVACPDTARTQTARIMEQRYNVALSRARDRLYLVRSVRASDLSDRDLKRQVIEHFKDPMAGVTIAQASDILADCDSDFEREVGKMLLERGYRLRAQVPVGSYRIDFVVEGEGDRRLAIELDGDRYHGPERWADDLRRQRALERTGWTFCWGSHWIADPQGCMDELLAALGRLDIAPMTGGHSPTEWTRHITVEPETVAASAPYPAEEPDNEAAVEGDTVEIRFADTGALRTVRANASNGLAQSLVGRIADEEVQVEVGGQPRVTVVERILRAAWTSA